MVSSSLLGLGGDGLLGIAPRMRVVIHRNFDRRLRLFRLGTPHLRLFRRVRAMIV